MKGYIKLYREIEDHWLWEEPKRLRAWLYLLFEAAWEEKIIPWGKDETVTLNRGQVATTIRKLNGRWGYCNESTLALLRVFEDNGMITRMSTPKRTIITIVNYEKYQVDDKAAEHRVKRKAKHTKEEEEPKNENIYTPSREQDLKFAERLLADEIFLEQAAPSLYVETKRLKEFAGDFCKAMLGKAKYHPSYSDYRQHFFNWVNFETNKPRTNRQKNEHQTRRTESDKLEARRGTGVTAKTADDFKESF